jgi:N-methylhydantoinase B
MRCYDVISEPGSMIDAQFPAAVGKASTGAMWVVSNVAAELMCRMLDVSPEHRHEVQSICAGTYDGCSISGREGDGTPFVGSIIDSMAGGFGAKVDSDGIDTGGIFTIPMGRAPDAEMTEFIRPVLYLWRREEIDSGGPGRHRGGVSGSACVVPWGTEHTMRVEFMGSGKATTINRGLAGGLPGSNQLDVIIRGASAKALLSSGAIPGELTEIDGDRDVAQCEEVSHLDAGDVLYLSWQSGGGYGDPLLRDPEAVAHDIAEELVSRRAAETYYGVVVDEIGAADATATEELRSQIRAARRSESSIREPVEAARSAPSDAARRVSDLDDNLAVVRDAGADTVVCRHCDTRLGELATFSLDALPSRDLDPADAGGMWWEDPEVYLDVAVTFRQYYCPGCFTALEGALSPVDHPAPRSRPVLAGS